MILNTVFSTIFGPRPDNRHFDSSMQIFLQLPWKNVINFPIIIDAFDWRNEKMWKMQSNKRFYHRNRITTQVCFLSYNPYIMFLYLHARVHTLTNMKPFKSLEKMKRNVGERNHLSLSSTWQLNRIACYVSVFLCMTPTYLFVMEIDSKWEKDIRNKLHFVVFVCLCLISIWLNDFQFYSDFCIIESQCKDARENSLENILSQVPNQLHCSVRVLHDSFQFFVTGLNNLYWFCDKSITL